MSLAIDPYFDVQIASHAAEIDAAQWEALSAGGHFQSQGWYGYGETVLVA